MSLHPEIAALVDELSAEGFLPLAGSDVDEARRIYSEMATAMASATEPEPLLAGIETTDTVVSTGVSDLAARIYRPAAGVVPAGACVPTVLYLHGGGHVLGDLDTHDWHARAICADTSSVVVSVAYRRAPEDRWPTAVTDARASFDWVVGNVNTLGGDAQSLGIAGDSAGANLAAVVLSGLGPQAPRARAALLLYPATDFSLARPYPSRMQHGSSGYLTVTDMGWFGMTYAGKGAPVDDPDLSPIMGDVTHYPPTVVSVAELDPLHDEGVALALKIGDSGAEVVLLDEVGMPHGYYDFAQRSAAAREAVKRCHREFARHLST